MPNPPPIPKDGRLDLSPNAVVVVTVELNETTFVVIPKGVFVVVAPKAGVFVPNGVVETGTPNPDPELVVGAEVPNAVG